MIHSNVEIQRVRADQPELPPYVTPEVRVMSESEVLSAFQVNATGTSAMWWAC